jgi:hypothetical protein
VQDRLTGIEARLARIEQRLDELEGAARAEAEYEQAVAAEPSLGESFVASASTHIGRVLLIFGGAYLLRAITDFEFVPTPIGLAMGAAYALYWLYVAWRRAADESQRAAAAFYGATSAVLILPLLVEAATTFDLLSGAQAIVAVAVYFALALAVGIQRKLRSIAWLVTAGAGITALALLITTRAAVPAAALLQAVGLATLWAVYGRGWLALQWLGALGASLGVVALITLAQSPQWSLSGGTATLFATLLLLAYLASFAARSELGRHDLGVFEAVLAPVAAGLTFWASAVTGAAADGAAFVPVGGLAIVLGIAGYGLALFARSHSSHRRNFYFYSALGLLFIVAGTALVLPATVAAALWSVMAVVLAWFSGRQGWVSLSLQCTVLLVAAGIASGLLGTGLHAFAGDATAHWPAASPWLAGTALATVVCLFIPVAQQSERWGTLAGLPQLIVLALSVWEVGGLMVVAAGPLLAAAGSAAANLSVLAALRTAVLAAASVTLALSSRFRRWPEARWLVYPVLIVVALKLFTEDFPVGQPATLFVALAFVGGALLAVAKLLVRREAPAGRESVTDAG